MKNLAICTVLAFFVVSCPARVRADGYIKTGKPVQDYLKPAPAWNFDRGITAPDSGIRENVVDIQARYMRQNELAVTVFSSPDNPRIWCLNHASWEAGTIYKIGNLPYFFYLEDGRLIKLDMTKHQVRR